MRILLCSERFLFRFGVDRVLIMLGQRFKAAGHEVVVMANRLDAAVVEPFASKIITVPGDQAPYLNLNEWTAGFLAENWVKLLGDAEPFDIVLVGGWPFFASVPVFKEWARRVVCLDYGAVPLDGMSEGSKINQRKLAALRRQFFPEASAIIAGSDFLADTQTRPDTRGRVSIQTILAGADHIDAAVWQAAAGLDNANAERLGLRTAEKLAAEKRPILLNLGRWEPGCYKNSEAAYDILRQVRVKHPHAALLIMADPHTPLPENLKDHVFPIGFPDDQEMVDIMRRTDVGISVSLWEGHNLPLSEMQWLERQALAFDVAAHPEVALDRWYLCKDNADMASKVSAILSDGGPAPEQRAQWLAAHRNYFTWDRAAAAYLAEFQRLLDAPDDDLDLRLQAMRVIIDVTNAARDTANSGVIRVTRRFARELQNHIEPVFAIWDPAAQQYALLNEYEGPVLGQYNGPVVDASACTKASEPRVPLEATLDERFDGPTWLILPEVVADLDQRRRWAATRGFHVAVKFHDAIPVLRPDLVSPQVRQGHAEYMKALAQVNLVVPNSGASAKDLNAFWRDHDLSGHRVAVNLLAGEFGGSGRAAAAHPPAAGPVRLLCVSTIEPRKNHRGLLEALALLRRNHPQLDWSITLVGNRYAGAEDLYAYVQEQAKHEPRIHLAGVVDDAALNRLYEQAAFTIYPSIIEGFGMPIVESLWHGKPCICSSGSVMGELAAAGGCLTTDVTDPAALAQAIHQLATDRALYEKLTNEAAARPMKTWEDYAREWLNILETAARPAGPAAAVPPDGPAAKSSAAPGRWQDLLYPGCLMGNWQMHDSERLSLTAVLARVQPRCSIEIGTFKGGSLSLIQQFSQMVFSIDIDPEVAQKFKHFRKVSFLTGPSSRLLPVLLEELRRRSIDVDFMLIDGDHSADGVRGDVEIMLDYVPRKPLFLMLHDGFNPECRRGMREARWTRSPYVQWVDLDFVPGRVIQNGSSSDGEMWGGLAAAYFTPTPRTGPLGVGGTAEIMYREAFTAHYPR